LLEVLVSNSTFEEMVATGAPVARLQKAAAVAGFRSLRENAVERVRQGQTTLEEVERVIGGGGTDQTGPEAPPPLVLLVDDDQVSRTLARKVLEKSAFRVTEAGNGLAALAQLEAGSQPALIILDLEMPEMGGREVLARVRQTVATAGLPVLVLTGSGTEEMEAQLMEEGADDYIRKPLEPARFLARVRAALRRAGE
jgi:CheY-like chemotaxis protein